MLIFQSSKTAIQIIFRMIFGIFVLCVNYGQSIGQDSSQADGGKRGFLRRSFVDDTGAEHRYVIFLPYSHQPGSRPPVLMFLNGFGENGDDGIRQISKNFGAPVWESREFFPFLAIAPQCRTNGSWAIGSLDTQWAMQILDTVVRDFNADEDRIYLTGVSAGGSAVWDFVSAFPDKFAAVIPMCGSGGGEPGQLAASRIPIWNFYNEKDSKGLVEFNRSIRKQLIDKGMSPNFTEYPHEGHDCWNRGYRTTALYEWLLLQRRSDNLKAASFTPVSASHALANWKQSGAGVWSTGESGDLIGRGTTQNERGLLISDVAADSIELHGDVWMSGTDCRVALLPQETVENPYWISIMSAEDGTGGFVDSGGKYTAMLSPSAQRTLRKEAWNDVRIQVVNNQLTVHLNGWKAIEVPVGIHGSSNRQMQYRIALATPDAVSEIRWRYVRTRSQAKAQESHKDTPQ